MRRSLIISMWSSLGILGPGLSSMPVAAAQAGPAIQGTRSDDAERAKLLGVLTYTKVTVSFDEVPLRDALTTLGGLLNVSFIGKYSSATDLRGLDPELPVTLQADQRFALDILEEMIEQCAIDEACTWQLRHGAIEVGTKQRLSSPSSREGRIYQLTDMLIEPPYNIGPRGSRKQYKPLNSPYIVALLGQSNRDSVRRGIPPERKPPNVLMLELAEGLVELVEPGHWDLGGAKPSADDDDIDPQHASPSHTGPGARTEASRKKPTPRKTNPDQWASMRAFQESFLITAPDFMHRELGGYPKPIPPQVTSVTAPPLDNAALVPLPAPNPASKSR